MSAIPAILACAACYGDPNSSQTQGMNLAIFTMLGVTAVVLGGIGIAIAYFARRARQAGLSSEH